MLWRTSSFFGFSLRTGALFIGYLGLIGNIIFTLSCIIVIARFSAISAELDGYVKDGSFKREDADQMLIVAQVLVISYVILSLIQVVFSTLLLVGVYKKRPKYIFACVLAGIVYCILYAIGPYGLSILKFARSDFLTNWILYLIILAFQIYSTMVIHSYRLKLLKNSSPIANN